MGLYRATFLFIYYMSNGLTFLNTYQNFAKFSGWSRYEWSTVCVKLHEK